MKPTGTCPRVGTDQACDARCAVSGYGTRGPCALTADCPSQQNAASILAEKVREIIRLHRPDAQPEEEDYDDTESAYSNGGEVTAWNICCELRIALANAGLEPGP